MSLFSEIAKDAFGFLESELGYTLSETAENMVTYVHKEKSVGIRIVYEVQAAFVFVFVYRLQAGELIENKHPIHDKSVITCFDFNDFLSDIDKMKPAFEYGSDSPFFDQCWGLKNFVGEFADRLKHKSGRLLDGDFSCLPRIQQTITARARGQRRS